MSEPIRVLIVDDHLIVREGLRLILETETGFDLVGEAADGVEAISLAASLKPDVILMDLRMPGMDGLSAIEILTREQPKIAIVILTTFNEDDLMRKGLGLGARGYLLKDTDRNTLFNTIRAAVRGETLLKPEILNRLLNSTGPQTLAEGPGEEIDLTDRELEVLQAVAQGRTSKEIAYKLEVTERTIKAHLSNIYTKLGVESRAAAVSEAMYRGWLPGR
ncbi:MAG: response regulator transcription factor [Anaerolineales bacterium]|nr:response regulator transcription factor [Anaerolineales bacterium]